MLGINSFYYTEIIRYKKKIRNMLLLYVKDDSNEGNITTTTNDLAPLFLVDHDNIDKECYNDDEIKIVSDILSLYFSNDNVVKTLNKNEAKMFINLAMNKRLNKKSNEILAMNMAEKYNSECSNELLLINMDIFREVCNSIDNKENIN